MSDNRFTRRRLLAASAVATGLGLAGVPLVTRRRQRFSRFILVTVDTLRPDHLGCYGYDLPTSPKVDAFAGECTRFQNAFAAAACTGPSMTALHTSRHPGETPSQLANGVGMPPLAIPTLATAMRGAGFATAAIVGNFILREEGGLTPGFDAYDATYDGIEENREYPERRAPSLTDAAIAWLEAHCAGGFLLWLHYQDPHGPYAPPDGSQGRFFRESAPARVLDVLGNQTGRGGIPAYQAHGDERDLRSYVARYDGEIAYFDKEFGRLVEEARRLGIMDDAVVIFGSDHGESFGERGYFCCHGQFVAPELTRVPLLLRVPGQAGGVFRRPVSLIDVAPTVLDLAGVAAPKTFRGRSIMKTMQANGRKSALFMETAHALGVVENQFHLTWGGPGADIGMPTNLKVTNDKKRFDAGRTALYDLSADPGATGDVSEEHPDWVRYLRGRCREYLDACAKDCGGVKPEPMDEATRETLRSLGYVS